MRLAWVMVTMLALLVAGCKKGPSGEAPDPNAPPGATQPPTTSSAPAEAPPVAPGGGAAGGGG